MSQISRKDSLPEGKPGRKRLEAENPLNKEGALRGNERRGSENREEVTDRKPMCLITATYKA